ncbi:MAG: NAD(P)/FAD-dependent oxidoreductase, partial [Rikenellaceae bacterium]
ISSHPHIQRMGGILLKNVYAELVIDGEVVQEEFGEIGFSERGIEGAVALRLSRNAVDAIIDEKSVEITLDIKPALDEQTLRDRIAREVEEMLPRETFADLIRKLAPKPLVIPLAESVGVHSHAYITKITQENFEKLIETLKCLTLPIDDYAPFEYAIITAGGVSCEDVNPLTMESLKVKGLYFAGEILDLDADTGGYNLQIAFSTGKLAGMTKGCLDN